MLELEDSAEVVGDAVREEMEHAAAVTPVPGGVGPMTIACLLSNTLRAARRRRGLPGAVREAAAA